MRAILRHQTLVRKYLLECGKVFIRANCHRDDLNDGYDAKTRLVLKM